MLIQTNPLKGRESILEYSNTDFFHCSAWLYGFYVYVQSPAPPPPKSRLKKKRAKITLQMFVSDNRYRTYAGSELHLLLCNWINVFEVALIHFVHPLLLSGPSGTVPISAVSQCS